MADKSNEDRVLSRREVLRSAFGAVESRTINDANALEQATEESEIDCSCLPEPDCDAVCPYGGAPRGDGTQACECTPKACEDPANLADVAFTGKWDDIKGKPNFQSTLPNIVNAGSAGPTANVTMDHSGTKPQNGSIVIPYFSVDSKGRITAYGNKKLTLSGSLYSNYSNYSAYTNYKAYTNTTHYTNYNAYGNYGNYYNYYDNCCGDTDGD